MRALCASALAGVLSAVKINVSRAVKIKATTTTTAYITSENVPKGAISSWGTTLVASS